MADNEDFQNDQEPEQQDAEQADMDQQDADQTEEEPEKEQPPEAGSELDFTGTTVLNAELGKEMQQSFLEYSMSVIISRALPDVRDGLKPVHRRILYAMNEAGSLPTRPHVKSARTVGDVIGKYHPHGDTAVYDTMVLLAQPFNMSVPLVDGHGNFGSIDGDSAAAMRYTEARLAKPAMELLDGLKQDTVDWQPNYDESLQEPVVLPARFPNLLVNGSAGIAVGMATNIPPHNLRESIQAACLLLDNPDISLEELMKVMPGPDFPTGGVIMGRKGILDAYRTGKGSITVRSTYEIKEKKNGRTQIIFKEIPYQVNRTRLLEQLGELIKDKKLPEISNVHDGADRHGIDIIIELKQNAIPQVVVNKLFKHTQLQVNFNANMLALVGGVPKVLPLKEMLQCYLDHQVDVVTRRTKFELKKARERAHILEGLVIALDNIDEVISIIRSSQTDSEAKQRLMAAFELSERQSEAILEMRLRRLTGLEREKLLNELKELREQIEYLERVLADDDLLHKVIKDEMVAIGDKYKTPRRTKIGGEAQAIEVEDLIADEAMIVTVTQAGYVKRMPVATYRNQKRGGKGVQGVNLKDNDFVEHLFSVRTHDYLLFFSSAGKVYRLKAYEIPEAGRHARGTAIVNLLHLPKGQTVRAVIATRDFPEGACLMFATAGGMVKKTTMDQYDRTRAEGLIAINLREDDELISVQRVSDNDQVIMVSSDGKAIRWNESEIRASGRDTMGVHGMNLEEGEHVVGMGIALPGTSLLVVTDRGYGKQTSVAEYPEHHRGGKGVYTIKMTRQKGELAAMKIVHPDDQVMIITESGVMVRTPVKGISELGRATQGVRIMEVAKKDKVTAVAIVGDAGSRAPRDTADATDDAEESDQPQLPSE